MATRKTQRSSTKRRTTRSRAGARRPRPTASAGPPVVVYIHGIGQRESAAALKVQWDEALFGGAMGSRTRMAYWADLTNPELGASRTRGLFKSRESPVTVDAVVEHVMRTLPEGSGAEAYVESVAARMAGEPMGGRGSRTRRGGPSTKALPLPEFLRKPITNLITRLFLRDTAAYFFDESLGNAMRERLRELLRERPGAPVVLVSHSQGTIISYDVLHQMRSELTEVTWLTLGSPLGIQEVQDLIRKPREVPPPVRRWLNFADPFDPVALDGKLSNDFRPGTRIRDEKVENPGRPQNPHSATGYLKTAEVRHAVRAHVGPAFEGPLSRHVVGRDVAAAMDEERWRIPVLIELRDDGVAADPVPDAEAELLVKRADRIEAYLTKITKAKEEARIDRLERYVAACLYPSEIEGLAAEHEKLGIHRVWRNATKRALLDRSLRTIHVDAARSAYGAAGGQINWAVLDTGIEPGHNHFRKHKNVRAVYDCTDIGPLKTRGRAGGAARLGVDRDGHGTHVAGIIAGEASDGATAYSGVSPRAGIYSYKVLRDDGTGEDSSIIKALDHIGNLNEQHSRLVIHGVNLSLGGPFDPWIYATGHSPICRELRRLWRQGVLVCVAAGNEGQVTIQSDQGELSVNADLSIGDPANLEECIAVGSVHKSRPQTFGISHFSSKGPTSDGRAKPDVVAPGERIISANALHATTNENYVEMSGTSMACPHVSGLLAAFLSVRREFIGQPDRVKHLLLSTCTDLGRDRYVQGAGVPNLLRMLTSV